MVFKIWKLCMKVTYIFFLTIWNNFFLSSASTSQTTKLIKTDLQSNIVHINTSTIFSWRSFFSNLLQKKSIFITIETNQQNIFNSFNTFVVMKVIAKSIVKMSFLFDWGVIPAGPPLNWSSALLTLGKHQQQSGQLIAGANFYGPSKSQTINCGTEGEKLLPLPGYQ